jgi:hypothetical protein
MKIFTIEQLLFPGGSDFHGADLLLSV